MVGAQDELAQVVQQLPTEVGQQLPPMSTAVTSFFDPLKSVPQTSVSDPPTSNYYGKSTDFIILFKSASSIVGAPPTQQQQPSANSASSTSHLFGHQSQGTALYSNSNQHLILSPQSDTSYQMLSAYGGHAWYSTTSDVAPPPTASYPQQQYQATPTAASYSQGYASSRYPSTATPLQPAAPVSSQAYSIYGGTKVLLAMANSYQY